MKIIIAKSTIRTGNQLCAKADIIVHSALDQFAYPSTFDEVILTDEFENFAIREHGDDYVFEMNDECILKYMHMYFKIIHAVAPFIKPAIKMFNVFKADLDELQAFIGKKK